MTIELGHFAMTLGLVLSVYLGIVPMIGAQRGDLRLMRVARPTAISIFALTAFAFGCLIYAFVTTDFSIKLVAQHANTELPTALRVAATWGSHEGSILLWVFMLSGWTCAVALFSKSLPDVLRARILAILGLVSIGFFAFLLFTSNPFERLLPPVANGQDLNPLLQDAGMIFHPPLLYMGYVGLSVAFAFAVAGLIGGHFDAAWARWARPWTTVAWSFLTLGIALGSFWAYYELGWGGWWFWDPVENASFMPWLIATALIHSLAVAEKRGSFKSWTVLLAILGFSLSLLGTFLVRSGVLTSVHAFATDPARGIYILGFLVMVIGGSLTLFAARAHLIGLGNRFSAVSRESMLLANNILLCVAMASVLLGTLYPLILDTLDMGKISVGPQYFNAVFVPIMAPALFLMSIGPLARWKSTPVPEIAVRLRWAFVTCIVAALLMPVVAWLAGASKQAWLPASSIGFALGFWVLAGVVVAFLDAIRTADGRLVGAKMWHRARLQPVSVWGMHLAHLGVAAFVLGITAVNSFELSEELAIKPGQSVDVGQFSLRFNGQRNITGPNYTGTEGSFTLFKRAPADNPTQMGAVVANLRPEKRRYNASQMVMTEAAIDRSLSRDIYVSMGEAIDGETWVVRAQIKPFINWIWLGCVMMALGGLLTVADKRYRRRASRKNTAADPSMQSA